MMLIKDLYNIISMATKAFKDFPEGIRLPDMNRKLNQEEIIALCYYESVIKYISSKGVSLKELKDIQYIESDSGLTSEDF